MCASRKVQNRTVCKYNTSMKKKKTAQEFQDEKHLIALKVNG